MILSTFISIVYIFIYNEMDGKSEKSKQLAIFAFYRTFEIVL